MGGIVIKGVFGAMYINVYKGVIDENIIIEGIYERVVCDMECFLSGESEEDAVIAAEEELRILLRWRKEVDNLERVNIMDRQEFELFRLIIGE